MSKKTSRAFSWGVFAVACTAFATHCGAGFVAGTQEVIYYVGKAYYGVLFPILAMCVLTPIQYVVAESARIHKAFNYKANTLLLYRPVGKVGSILFEVAVVCMVIAATASVIAGGGTIVNDIFGLPSSNLLGTVVVALIVTVISIYGVKAVEASSTFMAVGIITIMIIIVIFGIPVCLDGIKAQWNNKVVYDSLGSSIWWALLYSGMQVMTQTMTISSCAESFENSKQSLAFAITTTLINIAMLLGACFLLQGFMPTVKEDAEVAVLPTLYAVRQIAAIRGWSWLAVLYPIMYLFAAITTGVGLVFSFVKRLDPIVLKSMENKKTKYGILSFGTMLICWIFSRIGLVNIVKYAYQYISQYALFVIIIPVIILGLRNVRKDHKKMAEEGLENLAESAE